MTIRPATVADLDALAALWDEFSGGYVPPWVPDGRAGSIDGITRSIAWGAAFVAEADGELIGFTAAQPYGHRAAELTELYVRAAARRSGTATALVRALGAALRAHEVERVSVSTGVENATARAAYARWGFRPEQLELAATLDEVEEALARPSAILDRDLAFALSLADEADAVTLARFRTPGLRVETKTDRTPVSEGDREVEKLIRARVARERPGERVLGEEEGADEGDGPRWIVDPIDATKNYVRGIPVWATLLALEDAVAVVSAPALGRRWWASRGGGAWTSDLLGGERRLRVSQVARVEEATLAYTSLAGWGASFHGLAARAATARGYGDFWGYVLLAEGAVDACVERAAAHWDLAAPQLVVEEAGGRLTDLAGTRRADGGSALATNGLLHDELLGALSADRVQ